MTDTDTALGVCQIRQTMFKTWVSHHQEIIDFLRRMGVADPLETAESVFDRLFWNKPITESYTKWVMDEVLQQVVLA